MKRISILILILASFSFGQVTSLSSPSGLARWAPGNKLNAGTIGDTSASNASLNYNFDRINAIVFRQMDGNGYFTTLYGAGLGNLIIEASGSHAYRIVLNDSVYSTYDWQTTGNVVVGGNISIGGYIMADSLVGGQLTIDSLSVRALVSSGDVLVEGANGLYSVYGLRAGNPGGLSGTLHLESLGSTGEPSGMTLLPVEDDFNDSLWIPRTTQSAGNDTLVIMNGEQTLYDGLYFAGQSGIATVGAGDSVQVTHTGFTSNGIAMLTFHGTNVFYTKVPIVGYRRTNGFTIYADAGATVAWFVVRK